MNIPLEDFLSSSTGVIAVIGLIGTLYKSKNDTDNLKKKDEEQDKRINDIIKWSHDHEEKAADQRERMSKDISKVEGSNLVVNTKLDQIMLGIEDIRERVSDLEKKS